MLKKHTGSRLTAKIVVLLLTGLFFATAAWAQNIAINVETSKGRSLSGLNVYAFTESGSYTGTNATTDTNGTAIFDPQDFQDGNYKFRVDYLGYQFWSQVVTLPGTSTVDVVIEEETAVVTFTTASGPAGGINVYLFTGTGSYQNQSDLTDSEGKTSFELPVGMDFTFRADMLGNQYWSEVVIITSGGPNQVLVEAGGGILQLTVEKSPGIPMEGINTYLFNISGTYLGLSHVTDSSGIVEFSVPEGAYKVRADYLGEQFWSQDTTVTENTDITLTIAHQDIVITIQGTYQGTPEPKEGINVYLFTASGSYLNQYQVTNASGQVTFNLPEQAYKVRADYLGQQFWYGEFTWQDTTVNIAMADAQITVTGSGQPLEGMNVYVFSAAGSYLNLNETTNADGKATFRLSAGVYKFRADYQGSQYWSGVETLLADHVNPITISTGGGNFLLTVLKGETDPLIGVNCYVFNEAGSYLGMSATTDNSGQVSFALADGTYKIRVDYLGYQFWTDPYEVPATLSDDFTIAHQDVVITIQGTYQGTPEPKEGIKVYLFTPSGSYLSQYQVTDENGHVSFNLPEQPYKVRADYMGQQLWSDEFIWQDSTVNIPMADAEITVTGSGQPIEGVKVYVFSGSGSYLGINGTTSVGGKKTFRLPAGSYKFRADYQGSQYWSGEETLLADQVNPITISTGGGTFTLTVLKGTSDPLTGVNCYVFNEAGSYLGMSATTDNSGQVSFALADGTYKIRVDYLGYQFWTDLYDVPTTLSDDFTIPHQGIVITVQGIYQGIPEPKEEINVYLFTPSGSYLSQYQVTDENGHVTFILPEQPYKVRADYLGQQFWSEVFTWQDSTVTIPHGMAEVHVHRSGTDVQGANVYLFTEGGSYLGRYDTTDASGMAWFTIPEGSYKFRADEGGDQKWSDPVAIVADQVTIVDLNLSDQPTVTISADPETIQVGESSTLTWTSTNADSAAIDQGIGSVPVNGSTTVSSNQTTTYTITVEGPGGTATDSAVVTVIALPDDVDLGLATDEQQGGGGLVGETIRVLNGNSTESRSDLQFPSPSRLGLTLQAFYNSRSDITSSLGYGWTHTYDVFLDPGFVMGTSTYVKIVDQTGRARYFEDAGAGLYTGVFNERSHVKLESGTYAWYQLDGTKYAFSASGQLTWMDDAAGNRLELAYDTNDRLETVTDTSSGRILTFHYNLNNLLESISGPVTDAVPFPGKWVTYGYDDNQNLTSVTYADDSGFTYSYTDPNDVHNLTEKRNKLNHLLNTWAYDAQDRAIDNFSVDGKGVSIVYESENQVNVSDAYGKEREYFLEKFAGRKRVSTIINGPGGAGGFPYSDINAVSWIYDTSMRPTEVEYAGGTINKYLDYDTKGNPGTIRLAYNTPEDRIITYTYHPDINAPLTRIETSVLGTGNKETIWDYDNDYDTSPNEEPTGLVSRIVEQGFTRNGSGAIVAYEYITAFTYNSMGQVLSVDGPLPGSGDTTSFTYDPTTGDLLTITRPLIGATSFSNHDAAGQVGLVTDINNQSKGFTYDGGGRVTLITNNADGSTNSAIYNTAGLPASRTDEDGVIKSFEYDSAYGRLSRTTDHTGNYISYNYDPQGNIIEKSYYDPSDSRTNWKRFDFQQPYMPGKLHKEINPDDTFTQYGYDLEGNISSVTDANNNTTSYEYDPLNRLITVTQPGSAVTSYTYDGHGNLQTVTDAESHTTTYQYDDMGRLASTTSPDTGTVTYVYDEAGNPVSKTDAKEITVEYEHDLLNRLTDLNFPDSAQDITYTYDTGTNGIGRRTAMIDPSGNMTFGYDSRGRLVDKTSIINNQSYTVSQSFTPGSRISSTTYPTGRTIDYDRTTCAYKVDAVSTTYNGDTISLATNLSCRPFGIAKEMNTGAGGTVNNTFDQSGRLTVANPGADKERTYTYDANSNLTSVTAPNTPWYDRTYTYDALNRLDHAEGVYGIIDYTYDDVGNRLTKVAGSQTDTYTYITDTNKLNEITGTETISYTHDANGNITGIGDKVLTYNQNNRLVMVEENGTTLGEYTYNGLGQRVIKEVDGVTTIFHYDFNGNIIAESDLDGNFTVEYLYRGKGRSAMVDVATEEIYYFGNDQLGTPQILTDSTNTVVWEGIYKPFGEADVNPNSSVVNNFRFLGQYYDSETGLHYNYYRYYDPKTGRYLRADPLHLGNVQIARQNFQTALNATLLYQYALSTPQAFNYYVYVYDNPVNWTDPMGLMGFALSGGGAYGSGWGQRDPKAYSASAGTGVYIGAKKGGYAEIGGFSYQAEGKPPGAKFGLGIDLTLYYSDAEKFFHGAVKYSSRTWGPFTVTEYYDQCEKVIGHTFSIFGRGIGLTGLEKGTSTGWIYPLQ